MAALFIPALMKHLTGGAERVDVPLAAGERISVRELLERADARHHGLLEALIHEDELVPHLAVFIDNDQALMGLRAKLGPEAEVRLLPPIVGGV